jgi:hypothetical protein
MCSVITGVGCDSPTYLAPLWKLTWPSALTGKRKANGPSSVGIPQNDEDRVEILDASFFEAHQLPRICFFTALNASPSLPASGRFPFGVNLSIS